MNFVFHCPNCGMQKKCNSSDVGMAIVCSWCNKHVIITSPGESSVFCPFCETQLTFTGELVDGIKFHCSVCDNNFVFTKKKIDRSKAIEQHRQKKEKDDADFSIGCLIFLGILLFLFLIFWGIWEFTGRYSRPPASSFSPTEEYPHGFRANNVQPSQKTVPATGKVTREMVIAETRKALDISAKVGNTSYNRFKVELCTITETKAACHFSVYTEGVRYVGAIEFNITPRGLIPSGQFYFDRD